MDLDTFYALLAMAFAVIAGAQLRNAQPAVQTGGDTWALRPYGWDEYTPTHDDQGGRTPGDNDEETQDYDRNVYDDGKVNHNDTRSDERGQGDRPDTRDQGNQGGGWLRWP